MINVPANIILLWLGTHAGIPAGFTRVTALDGKYPKGANGSNQNTSGGNANHTHSSPVHHHNLPAHKHTFTISGITNFADENRDNNALGQNVQSIHSHNGTTPDSAPGNTSDTAVTYGSAPNDPPYNEVIFITGDGAHPLPDGAVVFIADGNLPANFSIPSSLKNKYFKGAATAADAGGSGGGYQNTHDIGHSHTGLSHDHGAVVSSFALEDKWRNSGGGIMCGDHQHFFTPHPTTVTINNFVGNLVTLETNVEPAYKKLLAVQKATGGDLNPGMIGLWLGSIASIPVGWNLLDGTASALDLRDFHLKGANDASQIGNTGGANTHVHAAQPHTHTTPVHTHAVDALSHVSRGLDCPNGQAYDGLYDNQQHPGFNVDNSSIAYDPANTTANASNNEPPYLRAHFIMFGKTYTQKTVTMNYRVRLNHQKLLAMNYKIHKRNAITLPFGYRMRKINWDLIPKPDL